MAFERILVAYDFGEPSRNALRIAIALAKQYRSALTIVHTWEVPMYAYGGAVEVAALAPIDAIGDEAQRQLDALLAEVRKDVPRAEATLKRGTPWREVLAAVDETRAHLVVMGTHHRRGLSRALLGSVAEKVVRMSPVPVLTVGAAPEATTAALRIRSILVPTDFGAASEHALELAIDLAKQFRASLSLVHTWEIPSYVYPGLPVRAADLYHPMKDIAQERLDRALAAAKSRYPGATGLLTIGSPVSETLAAIEHDKPDLVIMGTHGRRGLGRAILGSVAEKIVRASPVPVLTTSAHPEA